MGDRLIAPKFKAQCLWRFTEDLESDTTVSDDCTCELLNIACIEITERAEEDLMRSQIFWYAGKKIRDLQKSPAYGQLLRDEPEVGRHMCLWMNKDIPVRAPKPIELQLEKFRAESEYSSEVSR
jgi:hypothetical protein